MLQTNKYSVREEQATDNNIPITVVHNIVKIKRVVGFPPQQVKHPPDNTSLLLSKSYVFGVMDSYKTGLERKVRSSHVGFVMAPTSTLHVGLSSNFYKKQIDKKDKSLEESFISSTNAKVSVNMLSAAMAWNSQQKGVTGHIIGSYGWGNIKNTRSTVYPGMNLGSKGASEIALYGALIRIGYNHSISKTVFFTPYVENILAQIGWKAYTETVGMFPCAINSYKETLQENSLGLHMIWKISSTSLLQAWAAINYNRCVFTSLISRLLNVSSFTYHNTSISNLKKYYTLYEVGSSYVMKFGERTDIFLNGSAYFNNTTKSVEHNLKLLLYYAY